MKIYILFFIISFSYSLNLLLHDYDNPSATHILDAEIIDDLLIVTGMIGGIEFYDISSPENLNHLTNEFFYCALFLQAYLLCHLNSRFLGQLEKFLNRILILPLLRNVFLQYFQNQSKQYLYYFSYIN